MDKHDIKVIRKGFFNDNLYVKDDDPKGVYNYLEEPIMGKKITDIKFTKLKWVIDRHYEIKGNGYTIELFIGWNDKTSSMYIITVNKRIYYYTFSHVFATASSAFHYLSYVYHGYGNGPHRNSSWTWFSEYDFDCYDDFHTSFNSKLPNKITPDTYPYYHTEYQKKKWTEERKYYIDKRIGTKEECIKARKKIYRHV